MTLIAPSTAVPPTRAALLASLAASGALLALSTSAAIAIGSSHSTIVHAVHLLVTQR